MYDELEQKRQNKSASDLQQIEENERKSDMDVLFGEKKKW